MRSRTRAARVNPGAHAPGRPIPTANLSTGDYERARDAFLEHGTIVAVEAVGFGRTQAEHLVHKGLPHLKLPPLQHAARELAAKAEKRTKALVAAVAEEDARKAAETAARALEDRRKAAEKAREAEAVVLGDAAKSREEELKLVRANRMASSALARIGVELLHTAAAVATDLREMASTGKLKTLSPKEKLGLVRNVAAIASRTAEVSQKAVQMERLLMGEPTAILGHTGASPVGDMTPEEAEKWFALAERAFRRRAARSTVIDSEGTPSDHPDLLEPGEEHGDDAAQGA
jgi:hypothetical protein